MLEVTGELDLETSPQLLEGLQQMLAGGARNVVIDLAGVGFMDSSALGTLVVMFKEFDDAGGRLCLAAVQPQVRSVLTITSVDRAIDVYDTVPAAEASMPPVVA